LEHTCFHIDVHDFIRQHHAEKNQHHDAAHVNHDLGNRDEISREENINSGDAEKCQQKRKRRVDDVFGKNNYSACRKRNQREEINNMS